MAYQDLKAVLKGTRTETDARMERILNQAREAAAKAARAENDKLPPDISASVVTSLFRGEMQVEEGDKTIAVMPGFTDHVTKHLATREKGRATIQRLLDNDNDHLRFDADQRAKLQRYLDHGETAPALEVVKEKRLALNESRAKLDREQARVDAKEKQMQARRDIDALTKNLRLTRLSETGFHKAVQAWEDGEIIVPPGEELSDDELRHALSRAATVFVVQHDWSSAFEKATDFADGEVQLPYDDMVFEFRIGGRRVCCCLRAADQVLSACLLLIETSVGWALGAMYEITSGQWTQFIDDDDLCEPILNLCRAQVRAVCIALEAQVVETEIVRAPHRLNRKRERAGKIPVFDHHIVNLAHRKRYLPRDPQPGEIEDEHHGKRLHFVRGHWRHYTNHKVWIKWFLRGNPDLGFVDKEYRL